MASTVVQLVQQAECRYGGAVPWGQTMREVRGGTYLIALSGDPHDNDGMTEAPIDNNLVASLLEVRPELMIDSKRPSGSELAKRLAAIWVPDEPVIYIGKATGLNSRVSQYYTTRLGARSPHAGGWPLKVLSNLESLWVHWATSDMPELAEQKALAAFVHGISPGQRIGLVDPDHPYPYANLEGPGGRKRHRIRGARASRRHGSRGESKPGIGSPVGQPAAPEDETNSVPRARTTGGRVTLHEEIAAILRLRGNRWMTTTELASEVAARQVYVKRDGTSDVTPFQIHGRTKNYTDLFERDGIRVRLRRP